MPSPASPTPGAQPLPRTVEDLARHRLIHLEERYREAADWKDWFASAGIEPDMGTRGLLINDYVLVIQAVMEGQGIALGWRHLTERLIDAGLLVRVTDHSLRTGKGVYVVWPRARAAVGFHETGPRLADRLRLTAETNCRPRPRPQTRCRLRGCIHPSLSVYLLRSFGGTNGARGRWRQESNPITAAVNEG